MLWNYTRRVGRASYQAFLTRLLLPRRNRKLSITKTRKENRNSEIRVLEIPAFNGFGGAVVREPFTFVVKIDNVYTPKNHQLVTMLIKHVATILCCTYCSFVHNIVDNIVHHC